MRPLGSVIFLCLLAPIAVAVDKEDEKKAKEVAAAFMKAVKSKDLDAVMKTVDVPFLTTDRSKVNVIEKSEALRGRMKGEMEKLEDVDKLPEEVTQVLDLAAIRKKLEERKKDEALKAIEKVLGDNGCIVLLQKDTRKSSLLIRVRNGTAMVVGIPD